MFSEYASRYLSKSQRPAPLFNGTPTADSDVDDYLEAVSSGSTDEGSDVSDSEMSSMDSESESNGQRTNPGDPPSSLLVERQKTSGNNHQKRTPKHRTGYSLWKQNVDEWNQRNPGSRAPVAGPSHMAAVVPPVPKDRSTIDSESGLPRPATTPDVARGTQADRKHIDNTVAAIYVVSLALSVVTATLVAFTVPDNPGSVYPIFVYSSRSLLGYTVLASVVSSIWLYLMRYFTRAVVQVSVFAVPVVLVSTSVVSILMSIHPTFGWHGLAHAAMRVSALLPFGLALLWVLYLRRVKDVTGRAADYVVLAAEVYNACAPTIVALTMSVGIASLAVTGSWSFFLARTFLEGRLGVLLGVWYSFMYLWTWGVICSLLRVVLANITAKWYTDMPMDGVLSSSIYEAMAYHFSSACLSALVALLVRLPMFILPSRLNSALGRIASIVLSASTVQMTSTLVLPVAVLKRCSLSTAAALINSSQFKNVDRRAYRMAKLFLVSARVCCSVVVGFLAWIHADRVQDVSSAYGYLVGIIAVFIGWTVMGASENMLSMIADAILVNYVLVESSSKRLLVERLFNDPEQEDSVTALESEYSDSA